MSLVKISDYSEAPSAETGKTVHLEHPWTQIKYDLALFKAEGKYYVITDKCSKCGGSLGKGDYLPFVRPRNAFGVSKKGIANLTTVPSCPPIRLWNKKTVCSSRFELLRGGRACSRRATFFWGS